MYKKWINVLLGVVVIGVAFMDLSTTAMTWTLGVSGAVIAATNLWSLLVEQDTARDSTIEHHV